MSATVVIHQPDFVPYLGFFHRLLHADLYVALDHVQLARQGCWTRRDKIKTSKGACWISLSTRKCELSTPIKDVELSDSSSWRASNLNLLRENYRAAPFFKPVFEPLEQVYGMPFEHMADLNLALIDLVCEWLAIRIPRITSSTLAPAGSKSEMIAGIVAAVGGTRYLSGLGARDYHEQDPFVRRGIDVIWQEFRHPVYPQQFGEFIPSLSVVDALFNCGPQATADMLRSA